jgi:hypothetical protein
MTRNCKVCNTPIPEGRLKAIPHTWTCTEHSSAQPFSAAIHSYGDVEDDVYQEIEILRTPEEQSAYKAYYNSLGNYK